MRVGLGLRAAGYHP